MAWPGRGAVSRYKICIVTEAGLAGEKAVSQYKFCIVTEAARLVREVCRNTC